MDNQYTDLLPGHRNLIVVEARPQLHRWYGEDEGIVKAACEWWVNQHSDRPRKPAGTERIIAVLDEFAIWYTSQRPQLHESAKSYLGTTGRLTPFMQFLRERYTVQPEFGLEAGLRLEHGIRSLIGESQLWQDVIGLVQIASMSSVPTLIHGELGTGKAQIARIIHKTGSRADSPCLKIPCPFLTHRHFKSKIRELVSEIIEPPDSNSLADLLEPFSTVYLADIDQLEPELQPLIAEQIRERYSSFEADGNDHQQPRFVVSTTVDLNLLSRQQLFRHDLFLEIAILQVDMPALRHRRDDVAVLADYILERLALKYGISKPTLRPDAIRRLECYSWPGNLVELRAVLDRALLNTRKEIHGRHLQFDAREWLTVSENGHGSVLSAVENLEKSGLRVGKTTLERLVTFLFTKGQHHFKTWELKEELATAPSTARSYMKKLHGFGFVFKHGDRKTTTWRVNQEKLKGNE
jgi:DNA-binding NtrC family response regulator